MFGTRTGGGPIGVGEGEGKGRRGKAPASGRELDLLPSSRSVPTTIEAQAAAAKQMSQPGAAQNPPEGHPSSRFHTVRNAALWTSPSTTATGGCHVATPPALTAAN